jgi:hypothetical protein
MSAILAMILGILAVAYALLPRLMGRVYTMLPDESVDGDDLVDAETTALSAWSVAAGELGHDVTPEAALPSED